VSHERLLSEDTQNKASKGFFYVKGYSRLIGEEEEATVRTITAYREVMTNLIGGHNGRVVDAKGDNNPTLENYISY
jgi:hypothetical protein